MADRRFTEIDLRRMLERAVRYRKDVVPDRWVVETRSSPPTQSGSELMKESYLEVTFRHGQPLAAYLYLPRRAADRSHRTERVEPGLVIDFNRSGKPIGIEITAPWKVSASGLNRVLRRLGLPPVRPADLAPLRAA
jgi:uncharacterized protein YuzE